MFKNTVGMLQVHGNRVVVVDEKDIGKTISNCDGLITNTPGIAIRVSTADCIPLSLFDSTNNSIGLIHAGWRGLSKGIIKKAVKAMSSKFGTKPENLIVGIGPHICTKHYEVKSDVVKKFDLFKGAIIKMKNKTYLDLEKVAIANLLECGVKNKNIKVSDTCTFEDKTLASYRRSGLPKTNYFFLQIPKS